MNATLTSAEQLVKELNQYKGDNIWQDVIIGHCDLAEESIDGDSDVAKFNDGSKVIYQPHLQEWVAYDA